MAKPLTEDEANDMAAEIGVSGVMFFDSGIRVELNDEQLIDCVTNPFTDKIDLYLVVEGEEEESDGEPG